MSNYGALSLSVTDPSQWPDVHISDADTTGHFNVVISGWRCIDGAVYAPAELAAGAEWRAVLCDLFDHTAQLA